MKTRGLLLALAAVAGMVAVSNPQGDPVIEDAHSRSFTVLNDLPGPPLSIEDAHSRSFTVFNEVSPLPPLIEDAHSRSFTVLNDLPEAPLLIEDAHSRTFTVLNDVPGPPLLIDDAHSRAFTLSNLGTVRLTLGVPYSAAFESSGESQYYKVTVPAGDTLRVALDANSSDAVTKLYVRFGERPTRSVYDYAYKLHFRSDQEIIVPVTQGGTYFILAYADYAPSLPLSYTILAEITEFEVTSVQPSSGSGQVTLRIEGGRFESDILAPTRFRLVAGDGSEIDPVEGSTLVQNSATAFATFNLDPATVAPGLYDVKAITPDQSEAIGHDLFEVVAGAVPELRARLIAPGVVRAGLGYTVQVEYANVGTADMTAPLLEFESDPPLQVAFSPSGPYQPTPIRMLGVNPNGPAGVLPPGVSGVITLYVRGTGPGTIHLGLAQRSGSKPVDWEAEGATLRPPDITDEEWHALWSAVAYHVGQTWQEFEEEVANVSRRLWLTGQLTYEFRRLIDEELALAKDDYASRISGWLVDANTGEPIINASLLAVSQAAVFEVETGSNGDFVLEVTPGTHYLLAPDYILEPASVTVTIAADDDIRNLILRATAREDIPDTIANVTPQQAGNVGPVTLSVLGAGFDSLTQLTLQHVVSGTELRPISIQFTDPTRLAAVFDLTGAEAGSYDLYARAIRDALAINPDTEQWEFFPVVFRETVDRNALHVVAGIEVQATRRDSVGSLVGPNAPGSRQERAGVMFVKTAPAFQEERAYSVASGASVHACCLVSGECRDLTTEQCQSLGGFPEPEEGLCRGGRQDAVRCCTDQTPDWLRPFVLLQILNLSVSLDMFPFLWHDAASLIRLFLANEGQRVDFTPDSPMAQKFAKDTKTKLVVGTVLNQVIGLLGEQRLASNLACGGTNDIHLEYGVKLSFERDQLAATVGQTSPTVTVDVPLTKNCDDTGCCKTLTANVALVVEGDDVWDVCPKHGTPPWLVVPAALGVYYLEQAEVNRWAKGVPIHYKVNINEETEGYDFLRVTLSCDAVGGNHTEACSCPSCKGDACTTVTCVDNICKKERKVCPDAPCTLGECDQTGGSATGCVDRPIEDCTEQQSRAPVDPNEKFGPLTYGQDTCDDPLDCWVPAEKNLSYTVFFENVARSCQGGANDGQQCLDDGGCPNGTCVDSIPAVMVTVTDQLSANLDWTTFRLGSIGFGDTLVVVPPDRTYYQTEVDLTDSMGLVVRVEAGIRIATGVASWSLTAIDPLTGQIPSDPGAGFLPPNVVPPEGEGFVTFTVRPKLGVPTGTAISNVASVVFDWNPAIDTVPVVHTLDADRPRSAVDPLPPYVVDEAITLRWTVEDPEGGSGLAGVSIYVSVDNGPFEPFIAGTTEMEAVFTGHRGHTYAFYSRARDNVGNVEPTPPVPDTTTVVTGSPDRVIEQLMATVNDLAAKGTLRQQDANSLNRKLAEASQALKRDNVRVACGKLHDFLDQVRALIGSGRLTAEQARPLIDLANLAQRLLSCER